MATILIIEDEKAIQSNIQEILELEDFEVLTADNGKAGVAIALNFLPDLIVCDISMPEMTGYEVLSALREHPDTIQTPFIFLSAMATKTDLRKGMSLGADDYLTKPFTTVELREAIESRLEKQAKMKERYAQAIAEAQNIQSGGVTTISRQSDRHNAVGVIKPTGVLDINNCGLLREEILESVNAGYRNILVDCQNLTFMDSSALATLVLASQKVREADGKLSICSIDNQIKMLFTLSSMDDIFEIYDNSEEFYAN